MLPNEKKTHFNITRGCYKQTALSLSLSNALNIHCYFVCSTIDIIYILFIEVDEKKKEVEIPFKVLNVATKRNEGWMMKKAIEKAFKNIFHLQQFSL